jgi:ribosomal protein L11 methylase PrmA
MTTRTLPSSFRDPDGFVFLRDGAVYRQVHASYRPAYERLFETGLHQELVDARLLIDCEEVDVGLAHDPGAWKVLRPQHVPFLSWPYEWSFSQLQDAALVTLAIQKRALQKNMTLKDASAYNIQFLGSRPVFIDTLSFEAYVEGRPWAAYRQFCEHFLAPLALACRTDVRLQQLLRVHLDGIPMDLTSRLVPTRTWLIPSWLTHIHLHGMSQRRAAETSLGGGRGAGGRLGRRGFLGLLDSLEGCVRGMRWQPGESAWSDYYETSTYTEEALEAKRRIVASWLDHLQPEGVWDLGANTGTFSREASSRDILTIAFDLDALCVDSNYRDARERHDEKLLPLQVDLANPSAAVGWHERERASLLQRGPAHTALALALVHHLAIGNNLPLPAITAFLADSCRHLIIEWVPKHDDQVQRLLSSRQDIFTDYTQESFEASLQTRFRIDERTPVPGTERTLYRATRTTSH